MRRNVELQVGTLVLVAIVILSMGLLFLKEFRFSTATWKVEVSFPSAGRVSKGAPLLMRGVEVGSLKNISLEPGEVILTLGIHEGVELPSDSRFVVQPDFMGPTYLIIHPGVSDGLLEPGAKLRGETGMDLVMIMNRTGGLLGRLDSVSAHLEDLLGDSRLDSMMDDLGSGARDLRAMAATGREGLPTALAELEALSAELRGFIAETRGPLGEGLEKLSGTAGRLDSLLADLQEAGVGLKSFGHQLETGQGTVGRLIQEEDLYLRLESTLDDLDSLLVDIKADPQRYLTFELF